MPAAPVGANVRITYDLPGLTELGPGHALVTRRGRVYLVISARRQTRGEYPDRWHVVAQVAENVPTGTKPHPLVWYKRGPRPIVMRLRAR